MRGLSILFKTKTYEGEKIDQSVVGDNQVLFAEISNHTASDLETLNKNNYTPFFIKIAVAKPLMIKVEDTKQFMLTFDNFAKKLEEIWIPMF